MINPKTVLIIAKKEISAFLDNPASYISLIVFLFLWEFFFFRSALLIGESSLRLLFDYLPWLLLLFASSITMGSFSAEKSSGTLELLLTHPSSIIEVIFGKFISSVAFISISYIFVIPIAIVFNSAGALDWGVVFVQLILAFLLTKTFVSVGLYFSVLLNNQISSLLSTVFSLLFMILIGSDFITANMPLVIVPVLERLSILSHADSMSRGVIDIRDLWYFISLIAVFMSLTYLRLLKDKFGNRKDYYGNYRTATLLLIGITILTNIVGQKIPGRLDFTYSKKYSLSDASVKILGNLDDIVTITLYQSNRLPSQFLPVARDVKDVLRDYQLSARGNISVIYKDPSADNQIRDEAVARGLREVQFNVIGNEEFQLKTGFLGLVVSYADKHESIPFIQTTSDIEYQLTSFISKLTNKDKKIIAFTSGHGEKDLFRDLTLVKSDLEKQFEVINQNLSENETEIATRASVLVVAGPTTDFSGSVQNSVIDFHKNRGNLLFLLDSFNIDPQTMLPSANQSKIHDYVSSLGVTVNQDLVYDLRSNETVRMGQGAIGFLLPYPYWLRTFSPEKSAITNNINGVIIPWGSSLSVNSGQLNKSNYSSALLLETSQFAGTIKSPTTIDPQQTTYDEKNLSKKTLAVALTPSDSGKKSGRSVIIGDSDFITDQFVQNSPPNAAFLSAILSYLTSQESLSGIAVKQVSASKLVFTNQSEPMIIKYGNLVLVIIVPVILAFWRFIRRRRIISEPYIKV